MYTMSVSKDTPTELDFDNPTSKNADSTPNLGGKWNATNECVELESNKHLLEFETRGGKNLFKKFTPDSDPDPDNHFVIH